MFQGDALFLASDPAPQPVIGGWARAGVVGEEDIRNGPKNPLPNAQKISDQLDDESVPTQSFDDGPGAVRVNLGNVTLRVTDQNGRVEIKELGVAVNEDHFLTAASILDKPLRQSNFHERHPILYGFYTVIGVNWEFLFQLPVWLTLTLVSGPLALPLGIVAVFMMAGVFAIAHPKATNKERLIIFAVGIVLGGVALMPGIGWSDLGWKSVLVSMGIHSIYNALSLVLEKYGVHLPSLHSAH